MSKFIESKTKNKIPVSPPSEIKKTEIPTIPQDNSTQVISVLNPEMSAKLNTKILDQNKFSSSKPTVEVVEWL